MNPSAGSRSSFTRHNRPTRRPENPKLIDEAVRSMWVILLEIGFVLGLAALIVWWTWPEKRDRDRDADREGGGDGT